jgi:acyl carrier protein
MGRAMTNSEVMADVVAVLREVFDNPDLAITPESNAETVPGWDSMKQLTILMAIEEKFEITLSTKEIAKINNIGELVVAVERKII